MNKKFSSKVIRALFLVFTIIFFNLALVNNNKVSAYTDSVSLYDGQYYAFKSDIVIGGAMEFLRWSFSGSKSNVGVQVFLMDEFNYAIWGTILVLLFGFAEGYTLSNGNHVKDSGLHSVPYEETWYIVFYVNDADAMFSPTTISFTITYIPGWIGFSVLFGIIFVVALIILIVVLVVTKKKRKKASLVQQPQPFIESTQQVIYCYKCGNANPHDAMFCLKCGTELVHEK
ncbi:MAG: zinc ribbon domain-containing protein [Asgard group archaeon]|nr:zinc ribbon domain-containing protein [Asgard group archaeon]